MPSPPRPPFAPALAFTLALVACSPTSSPPASSPTPPAVFAETDFGRYQSARLGFSLTLPDGHAWRIEDDRSAWMQATHAPTSSRLRIRASIERSALSREGCLARARDDLPDLEDAIVIDDRVATLADEEASVWIRAAIRPADDGLEGLIVASAVSLRRCLVLLYETRAQGDAAPEAIAERLALVADTVIPSLRFTDSTSVPRAPR